MKHIINLEAAVETHVGLVRESNEDNFYFDGEISDSVKTPCAGLAFTKKSGRYLFAVCDGMGGMNSGEKASCIAAGAIKQLKEFSDPDFKTINKFIGALNDKIYYEASDVEDKGMGTTLAALVIKDGYAFALNVGDSRAYHMRGGKLTLITEDHTQAQRLIKMRILTESEAKNHYSRHLLSRYLGMAPEEGEVSAHFSQVIEINKGDSFLIASDGLTEMLEEEMVEKIMQKKGSASECAKRLVKEAIASGGRDNITVIVLKINNIAAYEQPEEIIIHEG
ncbi:MAG: serine/threonine-protein phosphatase [Clostridiaceae bacterium]|nr:serine/threonine-protein phosphatase [Clostridiaceae bacterium]